MIVQIYTAQTPAEAAALAEVGVDHVGVTIAERGLPGEVGAGVGGRILDRLRDGPARSVALTVDTDLDVIRDFIDEFQPDIVHLCGDTDLVGPDAVASLRHWVNGRGLEVELMQAIGVEDHNSIDLAAYFAPHVDWLILDSVTASVDGIGAAGVTHDWAISGQIVQSVSVPVILAGGLGPGNVAEAIAAVKPAGVDSLTRTNQPQPDGTFRKNLDAVRQFALNATTGISK